MTALSALIVEDEALARKRLVRLLKAHQETVAVVGEADHPQQAMEVINTLKPDLIFLDIQMPGMNGFEMLRHVQHNPLVIFTTAYAEYAVQAFEENALDYLLKPVEAERLAAALERVRAHRVPLPVDQLSVLADLIRADRKMTSIPVKVGERFLFIALDTITHFEARDKYVYLHTTQGKEYLTDHTLISLIEKLPAHFIQVHRAYIVNRLKIKEIQVFFNNRYVIYVGEHPVVKIISGPSFADVVRDILIF